MIAIYARQSVDKKDSISIETQIEACIREIATSEDYKTYSDKGYSGSNTNRPRFEELMKDVVAGNINRVVVYKLDRISRSLLDFVQIYQTFRRHNVEFLSCNEKFDTSTPIGKAMLSIVMVFAELERETIQERIRDNYYSRGEKGFYLGGYAPFGYNKVDTTLEGKKTYMYSICEEEAVIVKKIFEDYLYHSKGLSEIARWLNQENIRTRRNAYWSMTLISRMLRNPTYVKANADIWNYFKAKGATLNNPIEDYVGVNGCYVYGDAKTRRGNKFSNLESENISLGLHEGIIEPNVWLAVQYKLSNLKTHTNLGSGSLSWLQGLVKCACGNYTCYIKRFRRKTKDLRYFYCRGKRNGVCTASNKMVRADFLEELVQEELLQELERLSTYKSEDNETINPKVNSLKIKLATIDQRIENLISQLSDGTDITIKYINRALATLDKERTEIEKEINQYQIQQNFKNATAFNVGYVMKNWHNLDNGQKSKIAKALIEKVVIDGYDVQLFFIGKGAMKP